VNLVTAPERGILACLALLLAAGCGPSVTTVPLDFPPVAAAFKGGEPVVVVAGHRTVREGAKPARHEIRIAVIDIASGKQTGVRDLGARAAGTSKFALSEDGTLLAAERADRRIGVWNTETGKLLASLPGFAEKTVPFAISRQQDEVIVGALRWRIAGAKAVGIADERVARRLIGYDRTHAISQDDRLVATAIENAVRPGEKRPRLELRREPGGDLMQTFDLDEPASGAMLTRISPDGRFVLLQNTHGPATSLTVWKTASGSRAYRVEKPAACGFAAWSGDGSRLLVRCADRDSNMSIESHTIK
jgi:hypothetical protein